MVEIPNTIEKKAELPNNNAVIMSSPPVKVEDVTVEHEGAASGTEVEAQVVARKQKADPIAEIRANQESVEKALVAERERRVNAERERDVAKAAVETTKGTLAKSEADRIVAQETAILNRVEGAKAELLNAKNAWIEAVDTGKPAAIQADLQEKIADATYKLRGAEGAKTHFDNWKDREKSRPAPKAAEEDQYSTWSAPAKAWLESHPRFRNETKYRRTAERAHEDATDDGIKVDSDEYFRRINTALADAGMEDSAPSISHAPARRQASGTSTAAPASHDSAGAGASGGASAEEKRTGRRIFKLDGEMRQMALKTYGKNTKFNLPDDEAYKRYAARMLEIKDKRANGERI